MRHAERRLPLDESVRITHMSQTPLSSVTKRTGLSRSIKRLLSLRSRYASSHHWLLSIYHRVLMRFPRLPLPSRNRAVRVFLKGSAEPFYVRLGTSDWYVLEEIFFDEVYAPLLKRNGGSVRQIIDLGANTGFSTRFWQINFPEASIIAVEPDDANLRMCDLNILPQNGSSRMRVLQACVLGTPRRVTLDRTPHSWGFMVREAKGAQEDLIEGFTVSQIMADCSVEGDVDIIKCNIEGAEEEVFARCEEWIDRVRLLAVQVHEPYTSEQFLEDLKRAGASMNLYHTMDCEEGSKLLFLERSA